MSSTSIKKYGLEFINDLAKDRKIAVQSLGVAFSAMKTELRDSGIITRSEEFKYVNDLMKHFRDEVNKNFESQLTQITIKSFGWIKRVLMQGEKILVTDESQEEELKNTINELTRKLKTKELELSRAQPEVKTLEKRLEEKEKALQDLKTTQMEQIHELQQQVLSEKNKAENASMESKSLQEELFDFQLELEEKIKQTSSLEKQNIQLNMDLVSTKGEITRLENSLKQARRAPTATDDDISAAMESMAISYQQQEEHYQKLLEDTKRQYEEMIKTKLQETTDQHQKEIEGIKEKLSVKETREKEMQEQLSEISMDKQSVSQRKEHLESLVDELTTKYDELSIEIKAQKTEYEKLQKELDEERAKADEKALDLRDIQLAKTKNLAQWLEQCLSYSNFSPLTILLRMGNEMKLEALAKSVGMDPIVLDNQLQELHNRDLIDIGRDGMIVANIPEPE